LTACGSHAFCCSYSNLVTGATRRHQDRSCTHQFLVKTTSRWPGEIIKRSGSSRFDLVKR
jgi:hypothetical protein